MLWLQSLFLGEMPKGGGLWSAGGLCRGSPMPEVSTTAPGVLTWCVWKLQSWRFSHLAGNAETQSDKILRLRVKRRLILWGSGAAGSLCSGLQQRVRHSACSMTGVLFLCKRRQLGDPNELGAQLEIVRIKSSCLLRWQMLFLQAADVVTVWTALRCDKCYLLGNLSCLTPSKDRLKLVK